VVPGAPHLIAPDPALQACKAMQSGPVAENAGCRDNWLASLSMAGFAELIANP
jgi:hypothetical protein